MFQYLATREELEQYANELFKMMAEGKFTVNIHGTYPLSEAAKAQGVGRQIESACSCKNEMVLIAKIGSRGTQDDGKASVEAMNKILPPQFIVLSEVAS